MLFLLPSSTVSTFLFVPSFPSYEPASPTYSSHSLYSLSLFATFCSLHSPLLTAKPSHLATTHTTTNTQPQNNSFSPTMLTLLSALTLGLAIMPSPSLAAPVPVTMASAGALLGERSGDILSGLDVLDNVSYVSCHGEWQSLFWIANTLAMIGLALVLQGICSPGVAEVEWFERSLTPRFISSLTPLSPHPTPQSGSFLHSSPARLQEQRRSPRRPPSPQAIGRRPLGARRGQQRKGRFVYCGDFFWFR